jgi:hypothetical protein
MRKLVRAVIRHQSYIQHGGIEGFRELWKRYRQSIGKWNYRSKRLRNHEISLRRGMKRKNNKKSNITMTGNVYKKPSIWKRIVEFFKRLGGK